MGEKAGKADWRPTPRAWWGWCVHACRNPLMGVVFLAGFVLCVLMLPARPPDDSRVVGWVSRQYRAAEAFLTGKRAKPMVNIGVRRDFAWVYLRIERGVAHDVAIEEMSGDELLALPQKYPDSEFVRIGYVLQVHRKGLWYPWYEQWLVNVTPEYSYVHDRKLDFVTLRTALDAAALKMMPQSRRVGLAIQRNGDQGSRILWGRVALNVLSVVLLLLVVNTFLGYRQWRGQRRWLRGRCPRCDYSLHGIVPVDGRAQCPECGLTSPTPP